jgi:hypothetical protein
MRLDTHFSRRPTPLLLLVCGLLAPPWLAWPATLVAPNHLETLDASFGAGGFRAPGYRLQSVYGAVHFPSDIGLLITELRFRPDRAAGFAFTTTVASIQVNLSTTTREPDDLSATFASNVGFDDTVVFTGSLSLSSQFTGPVNGPKAFDMVIPLIAPFLYNPAAGNLLVEFRNFSGSTEASPLSGEAILGDAASRLGGGIASLQGGMDTGADALQIVYTPTVQPPVPPQPIQVMRGPYLQNLTRSNIVVRWRTNRATNSVVRFGLEESLTWAMTNNVRTNDHTVVLTNLAPDTKYYYAIGARDTNLVGGPKHFFITAPSVPKPTRIWAMGDFGTFGRYGNGALAVRDAYYNFTTNRYTDIWLMLGDNAYDYGTDQEYQRAVFDVYQDMLRQTVAWSTIGNHETYGSNKVGHIAYFDIFNHPTQGEAGGVPSGTINYYSFDYGNIHFVCLDSELSDQTDKGPMATWLREDLTGNTNEWLIAYWHSPPYTKGSHDSDNDADTSGHLKNMREVFVPILEAFGVDLILGGHSHNYERSHLLHGHYGKSFTLQPEMIIDAGGGNPHAGGAYEKLDGAEESNGAVYVVAGSGGFATFAVGRHPVMYAQFVELGSLVLDVNSNRLDAVFLRDTGEIGDAFTIIKGPAPLRIEKITFSGEEVTLQLRTVAGKSYRIERATHLGPSNWASVGSAFPAIGPVTLWTDVVPPGPDARFYRAILVTD